MYFFYVDESGTRTPLRQLGMDVTDGCSEEHVYVLAAVSLFESHWHGFNKTINREKQRLADQIYFRESLRLDLADCEIKSNWVRIPRMRFNHAFLSRIADTQLTSLIDLYYRQLTYHHMRIFCVVIDKRCLHAYMNEERIHRKSWELLCESIQSYMALEHSRHQAVLVTDDVSRQMNRSLAMKHAYIQDVGTASGKWLTHICEMPLFVRSEFSNGVQLADLCAYNVRRAFLYEDFTYEFFERIRERIWCPGSAGGNVPRYTMSGIRVFPPESPLAVPCAEIVSEMTKKRASPKTGEAQCI